MFIANLLYKFFGTLSNVFVVYRRFESVASERLALRVNPQSFPFLKKIIYQMMRLLLLELSAVTGSFLSMLLNVFYPYASLVSSLILFVTITVYSFSIQFPSVTSVLPAVFRIWSALMFTGAGFCVAFVLYVFLSVQSMRIRSYIAT